MLSVVFSNKKERGRIEHESGPLEFGRGPEREVARCVIQDEFISRDQLRVEELPGGRLRLENLSQRVPVIVGAITVEASGSECFTLPVQIEVGQSSIILEVLSGSTVRDSQRQQTLSLPPPGSPEFPAPSLADLGDSPAPEILARWFERVVAVQRAAATSNAFFNETARALVELVGLDSGFVLLRPARKWQVAAKFGTESDREQAFSQSVLRSVVEQRRTFCQDGSAPSPTESLIDVTAVVASPILGADNTTVIGAVYGARFRGSSGSAARISALEAQMVQVLAAAVGAGMARLDSEKEVIRRQVQFEQFFSPEIARELDRNPGLLVGCEREVTVLFADIRGFSRLAERIDPEQTFMLVQDVMERLTKRVRDQSGVLVDYIGDGLMAMWNAPAEQPQHAAMACRAALAMLDDLPAINARWQTSVETQIGVGIGLNTGTALVGNTGSRQRLKYGPLGHTVNLASRLEGATRQLAVSPLISGSTQRQVADLFATRRLCRVRVVGMLEPVDVFELHAEQAAADWTEKRDTYEAALGLFEEKRWPEACRAIYPLLSPHDGSYDVPSLTLASRVLNCLRSPPENFDPVLELTKK